MSLESVMGRVFELQSVLAPAPAPVIGTATVTQTVGLPSPSFAQQLGAAGAPAGAQRLLMAAQAEVGQVEQPPGSNDSARISQYRATVPGGPVGPWCAYFASWAAAQNGTPLGERGQGFARVDDVWAWAQRSGRAVPNGPATQPQPGDLIIWDEHMGIVESVLPDGRVQTIEGNSSDSVARRIHDRTGDGAVGYVRMS